MYVISQLAPLVWYVAGRARSPQILAVCTKLGKKVLDDPYSKEDENDSRKRT